MRDPESCRGFEVPAQTAKVSRAARMVVSVMFSELVRPVRSSGMGADYSNTDRHMLNTHLSCQYEFRLLTYSMLARICPRLDLVRVSVYQ